MSSRFLWAVQLAPYVIIVVITLLFLLSQVMIVYRLRDMYLGSEFRNAYVSDEIYYVSSARNYLVKIFGIRDLRVGDQYYFRYTVFFMEMPSDELIYRISKECGVDVLDNGYSESYVVTIVVEGEDTNTTFYKYYGGANAVYLGSSSREAIYCFINGIERFSYTVIDVLPGWAYPDKPGINSYFNLEHPPLGKYFIALSIYLLGDHPVAWRIPSLLSTIIVFILSYFICVEVLREVVGEQLSKWVSLLVPAIMYFDNSLRSVGILAMLDPFVSMFTIIGVYFFVREKSRLHNIMKKLSWILAGCCKFSGLFIVPADIIDRTLFKTYPMKTRLKNLLREVVAYVLLYAFILVTLSLPLINYFGINKWFEDSIIAAIRWHTRTKQPLSTGPPVSSPIDWLFGWNAFPLWYDWGINKFIKCVGIPPTYVSSFTLGLILAPLLLRVRGARRIWFSTYSIWAAYLVLYVIGNRSLYSFYIIQFSPLLTIQFIVVTTILFKEFIQAR